MRAESTTSASTATSSGDDAAAKAAIEAKQKGKFSVGVVADNANNFLQS